MLVRHRQGYAESVDNLALAADLAPAFGIAIDVKDHAAVETVGAPEVVLELAAYRRRKPVLASVYVKRRRFSVVLGYDNRARAILGGQANGMHARPVSPSRAIRVHPRKLG